MKLNNTKIETVNNYRRMILAGALATAAIVTAACSSKPSQKVEAAQPLQPVVKTESSPAANVSAAMPKTTMTKSSDKGAVRQPVSKLLKYKSRDYAVSFEYPWQYSLSSAQKISQAEALRPHADGFDGQITLARIDLPKGYYPDTNFESGYFTASLNPAVKEQDCKSTLVQIKRGTPQVMKFNDTDLFWVESEEGGKGSASKVRSYVTFANDVCYEFEVGVKTRNEDGLAREVNVDQVMRKLDGILKTVKIGVSEPKPVVADLQNSDDQPKIDDQN